MRTLAAALSLALSAHACVQVPDDPPNSLEDSGLDASVAFGLSTDAGAPPPTGNPYTGPECDALQSTPSPMQAVEDGDDAVLMPAGHAAAEDTDVESEMDGQADAMRMREPAAPGEVLITELMPNPAALADGVGEWIELHNPGSLPLDLGACELIDGDQRRALVAGLVLPAGAHAVLARADAPGLSPLALVPFTLNNGSDRIGLSCGGVEIDVVAYDGSFPAAAGASLALSADAYDAQRNDAPDAWCLGTTPYAVDLGTPGEPNPPCDAGAADADADAGI